MAGLRPPALRYAVTSSVPVLRGLQRRWARVHDVRFVATHPEPDRILERYREKLNSKAKQEGLPSVNDLREAYKKKIEALRKEAVAPISTLANETPSSHPSSGSKSPFPAPPAPPSTPDTQAASRANTPSSVPGIKTLSSFIDIPKTLALPSQDIEYIWRLRHAASPTSLCAVIPTPVYTRIASTAQKHPQFILPLPRESSGAEIHFLQWTFPTPDTATVLFTHLAEYKLRGEYSQPHTTITHHLDLADPKGLVLLQGNVIEGRGVSVEEGKWLVMCLQKFYGAGEDDVERAKRKRLLESFSQGDESFDIEELVEEAEKVI